MKRFLIIGVISVAMLSMLCVGLALGVLVTPVRAQIGSTIERVLSSSGIQARNEPRVNVLSQSVQQADQGILIAGVAKDSPAEKAGLRRGDILLKVDGQAVNDLPSLQAQLQKHKAGDAVELLVQRGDEQKTLNATLAAATGVQGQTNTMGIFLGIQSCGGNFGRGGALGLGQNPAAGARIVEVVQGSPAEKAGLKIGDQITSVDGKAVDAQNGLAQAIAAHKPGDSVKLQVLSADNQQREVTVVLGDNPEKKGTAWLGVRYGSLMHNFGQGLPWMMPENPGNGTVPNPGNGTVPNPGNGIPFPPGAFHRGGMIQEVVSGSPAEQAGLKAGQVITAVDGETLQSSQALSDILAKHKPGDTVALQVTEPNSSSNPKDVKVTLGEKPDKQGTAWLGIRFGWNGIRYNFSPLPEG